MSKSGLNDKLKTRYLYQPKPLFSFFADKLAVKKYVDEHLPEIKTARVMEVTKTPESIKFDELPNKFIIKPNHLSGVVLRIDKQRKTTTTRTNKVYEFDEADVINRCCRWLTEKHGVKTGEMWYSDIDPYVFVEDLLAFDAELLFYCFQGEVAVVQHLHPENPYHCNWYSSTWRPLSIQRSRNTLYSDRFCKPAGFDNAVSAARQLSKSFDFVRVDLFLLAGNVYFCELTFAPGALKTQFLPQDFEILMGHFLESGVNHDTITSYY